ncbi:MAG: CDP-alcohol phosphatidyltransferase family protein [Gammaproteobacteria bacterium]
MLDTRVRPWLNPMLNGLGKRLAALGISANALTALGLLVGLCAAAAITLAQFKLAFALIVINRLLDGLDGAVARASAITDRGGYFDIVADYVFYAAVPLAFGMVDPINNALPAATLLGSFCLTASSFMAFAAIAARRGLETEAHGKKSFFYSTGLVEGTETVVFFLLMAALPQWFAELAWVFSALCALTVVQRSALAIRVFK